MGLLGGLNHGAYTDLHHGATTNPDIRDECLTKDWTHPEQIPLDICVAKWDSYEHLAQFHLLYD